MTITITFLGGEETGDVARVKWGDYVFQLDKPVECTDTHIIAKARGNRFFRVDGREDASVDFSAETADAKPRRGPGRPRKAEDRHELEPEPNTDDI